MKREFRSGRFRFKHDVVAAYVAAAEIKDFYAAVVAHNLFNRAAGGKLLVQPENMLPYGFDCAPYLFRADGKPRVVLLYEQLQRLPEQGRAAMVGYLLKNTVSERGTVSRAVCRVEDGHLLGVKEVLKIRQEPDGTIHKNWEKELKMDVGFVQEFAQTLFFLPAESCYTILVLL